MPTVFISPLYIPLFIHSFVHPSIHLLILLTKEIYLGKEWLSRAILSLKRDLPTSADIFRFHALKRETATDT